MPWSERQVRQIAEHNVGPLLAKRNTPLGDIRELHLNQPQFSPVTFNIYSSHTDVSIFGIGAMACPVHSVDPSHAE